MDNNRSINLHRTSGHDCRIIRNQSWYDLFAYRKVFHVLVHVMSSVQCIVDIAVRPPIPLSYEEHLQENTSDFSVIFLDNWETKNWTRKRQKRHQMWPSYARGFLTMLLSCKLHRLWVHTLCSSVSCKEINSQLNGDWRKCHILNQNEAIMSSNGHIGFTDLMPDC